MTPPIRILHVDDDPDLAEMTAQFIERADDALSVTPITDPTSVMDRLREADGALEGIIADYDMPVLNGLALLEQVRTEYPTLPFILFTGKGSEEVAGEAISLGVTDYMQKEIGTEQYEVLANRIKNAVERRRAERDLNRSEAVLETLSKQDIVGIFIIEDGRLTYVNQRFAEIFGTTPDELIGTEAHQYAAPADRDTVKRRIENRLEGDVESHHYTFTGQRVDGSTVPIEVHGARTVLNGEPATVGVLLDRS